MNARVSTLEKERSELSKRENDARKKAKDANSRARKHEEEIESHRDTLAELELKVSEVQSDNAHLKTELEIAEKAALQPGPRSIRPRGIAHPCGAATVPPPAAMRPAAIRRRGT